MYGTVRTGECVDFFYSALLLRMPRTPLSLRTGLGALVSREQVRDVGMHVRTGVLDSSDLLLPFIAVANSIATAAAFYTKRRLNDTVTLTDRHRQSISVTHTGLRFTVSLFQLFPGFIYRCGR